MLPLLIPYFFFITIFGIALTCSFIWINARFSQSSLDYRLSLNCSKFCVFVNNLLLIVVASSTFYTVYRNYVPVKDVFIFLLFVFVLIALASLLAMVYRNGFKSYIYAAVLSLFMALIQPVIFIAYQNYINVILKNIFYDQIEKTIKVLASIGPVAEVKPLALIICLYFVATAVVIASEVIILWILKGRYKKDYGRDYYNRSLKTISSYAAIGLLISYSCFVLVSYKTYTSFDLWLLACMLGLPLICLSVWICVAFSKVPLRHKPGLIISLPLIIAGFSAQAYYFAFAMLTSSV